MLRVPITAPHVVLRSTEVPDECKVIKACRMCEKEFAFKMSYASYQKWQDGELIQHALPTLTADERELLISGICGPCFDKLFADL